MSTHRLLALVAGIGALCAALLGSAKPAANSVDAAKLASEIEREADHVTATELAEWIHQRKGGLRVIDIRTDSEFQAYHIPSAERVMLPELTKLPVRTDETLVLYSGGGAHAAQAWVLLRTTGHPRVYFLRGGLLEWMDDVMTPTLPAKTGDANGDSLITHASELSRYFGGVPRTGAVPLPAAHGTERDASAAVARLRRRGC